MQNKRTIKDPVETLPEETCQFSPGNPLGLVVGSVVVLNTNILRPDGSTLQAGAEVVIREIPSLPNIYQATIEPMGVTGTTGEYLTVQLPLLSPNDPPEYLVQGCSSMPIDRSCAAQTQ